MPLGFLPEYAVRNPDKCRKVRRIAHDQWIAEDERGRYASGHTPAGAIAKLKR